MLISFTLILLGLKIQNFYMAGNNNLVKQDKKKAKYFV